MDDPMDVNEHSVDDEDDNETIGYDQHEQHLNDEECTHEDEGVEDIQQRAAQIFGIPEVIDEFSHEMEQMKSNYQQQMEVAKYNFECALGGVQECIGDSKEAQDSCIQLAKNREDEMMAELEKAKHHIATMRNRMASRMANRR